MPTLFDRVLLIGVSAVTIPALVLAFVWLYVTNPVFAKDVQTRMRGARAYVILGVYIGILSLFLGIGYLVSSQDVFAPGRPTAPGAGAEIGRRFYWLLLATQGTIIILFTPAFTAGAITLEREQQTFEMLLVTRLRPGQIVWGRLWSASFFPLLLLVTSAPLVSVTFLLGGVAPEEMLYAYVSQALCALVIGAFGILSSVLAQKTALSTITAFGLMMGYVLLTTAAASATGGLPMPVPGTGTPFAGLNPYFAIGFGADKTGFFSALVPAWITSGAISILLALAVGSAAVQQLSRYYQQRRPWAPMLLMMLLVMTVAFVLMGWMAAQNPVTASGAAAASALRVSVFTLLCAVLAAAILAAPAVCSSDGLEISWPVRKQQVTRLFHPLTWLSGDRLNGLPYFLGWIVVAVLLALLGLALAGGGLVQARWQNVLAMFVMFGLAVACYCTLTVALSGVLRRRWAAAAVSYALIIVTLALPLAGMAVRFAPYGGPSRQSYPSVVNFLYVNPFAAMIEVADPGQVSNEFGRSLALNGAAPFYVVYIVAMAMLTAIFAFVALVTIRRRWEPVLPPQTAFAPPRVFVAQQASTPQTAGHAPAPQPQPGNPAHPSAAPGAEVANPGPRP